MSADDELREKLATIEHERWSDWHKWCHKIINENIPYNKPLEVIMSRWDIQANKSYKNLSKKEQASDMEQVDRYWPLIEEYVNSKLLALKEGLPKTPPYPAESEELKMLHEGAVLGFQDCRNIVTALIDGVIGENND